MATKSSVSASASASVSVVTATPTNSINFFRVCRIILDDCPDVLREIFKQAVLSKFRHNWSDNRVSGKWFVKNEKWQTKLNRQQIHLLEDGNSSNWDPTLLFHVLLYSSLCLLADDIQVQATLQHGSRNVNLSTPVPSHIVPGAKIIFDCGPEMFLREVVSVSGKVMNIKVATSLQCQTQTADLLWCTSEWRTVEKLSFLRNEQFAHCKAASTTASELHSLVRDVEVFYKSLKLSPAVINRMKAIETEEIAASSVMQRLQDYQQKWVSESLKYEEVNKTVLSIQGEVVHLQIDVATIRDQDIPKLKGDLCNIDKDQKGAKLVADSLLELHRTLEGKVDLNIQQLQSLDQGIKVQAVSHMQEVSTLKLVQEKSEQKILEHDENIQTLKINEKQLSIVQQDIVTLRTKQTYDAARVSYNVQMVQQLSSQTKKEIRETKAIVEKATFETEQQLGQLSHKGSITAQNVSVLEDKVTEIDDDVRRIKGDVEQIHHKSKTAENESLQKLNPSHFESDIQYYTNKHHPATRQWLLDQISARFSKQSRKKVCIITGNPGMGKSVIAAKLCRFHLDNGTLAGCFFFQHHKARRSTPRMLIQTLAYHFCSTIPPYREIITDVLVHTDIQEMNCADLFTCLILEPLFKLPAELYLDKYIVIDALDECAFEFHSELMKLIIREFIKLPVEINVVLTTRPDKQILQELKKFRPLIELSPSDPRNIEDITLYLSDILRDKIDPMELDAGLELLVKKSEGMFLYFHYAIDTLLEQSHLTFAMLESLLPDGIDDYYDQNFKRLYSVLGHDRYHALLEAVVACRTDLPQEIVTVLLNLSTAEESASVTQGISVLLPLSNGHFHMFHKSIRDWLVSEEFAGSLVVDPILGHKNLAILCRSVFQDIRANKDTQAQVLASPAKQYAVENIAYHLCNSYEKGSIELLISTVVNLQFIYYRLLLSKGTAANLLDDYSEVEKLLIHVAHLRMQVEHCIAFVKCHAQQISAMPYLIFQLAVNEPDTTLDFLEVQEYLQDPKGFFPDMKMYFEISNKSQILGTASMSYACKEYVTYCIESLDKKLIICSDIDGYIYIWTKETAELVHKQKSEDHSFILYISNLSLSSDGKVTFGNINSALSLNGNTVELIPSAKRDVNACAFSRDSKKLLAWSHYSKSYFKFVAEMQLQCNPMYILELWDLQTFTCKQLESTSKASRPSFACFSHDDSYILCGHYSGTILQWESATGTLVAILYSDGTVVKNQGTGALPSRETNKEDPITHISCSPNGYYLAACCSKGILIWDALSLAHLQVLTCENTGRFQHCSFSSDSCCIVAGSIDGYLKVWKKESSANMLFKAEIKVKLVGTATCILSPILDDNMNVICGIGNSVNVYSYSSLCHASQVHEREKPAVHPGGATAASFLPNTLKAVTCGNKCLYLWDAPTHSVLNSAAGVIGSLIRLSSDGNWLLTYGDGVYIQVWDTRSLSCQSTLMCSQEQSSPPGSQGPNDSSPADICHCAISNTGLVVGGTGRGELYLWYGEKHNRFKLLKRHQSLITFCEFLPDGSRLLTADMDGYVTMWQLLYVNDNVEVNKTLLASHKDSVEQVCFYPNVEPRRIISCSSDKNLHLYDGQSGELIKKMKGHSGAVMKLAVSFDRNVIASGDERGQVILWDTFTGVIKNKFPHVNEGIIQYLQFLCDSSFTCTLDNNSCAGNVIHVYDTLTGSYVSYLTMPTKIIAVSASSGTEQTWLLCGTQDQSVKFVKVHKLDKNAT